jgi:hypothetical protein
MRYALAPLMFLALAAGCSSGSPDQPYTAVSPADPPPFYSDEVIGRPVALNHPFRCTSCGWYWR